MLELAFVLFTMVPELVEISFANIKTAVPTVKGKYRDTWPVTGKQVKELLGKPSHVGSFTVGSAGTWHICWCDYPKLNLRVILYAENQLFRELPSVTASIPEDWELANVQLLRDPSPNEGN